MLLDTHALLWWLSDDPRLGNAARECITDPANDILVSAVSLWEILVKVRVGKLLADIEDILAELQAQSFTLLPIAPTHLVVLVGLPMHHRDPFDHLLIAQAIAEGATFLSADSFTPRYPVQHLTCSDSASGSSVG
nr:type II toxin-antitoxin system VapC family toxin [Roseomonas haemaphysalidis]